MTATREPASGSCANVSREDRCPASLVLRRLFGLRSAFGAGR